MAIVENTEGREATLAELRRGAEAHNIKTESS